MKAFYGCTGCGRYLLGDTLRRGYTCVECSTTHKRHVRMMRIGRAVYPLFEATLRLGGRDAAAVLLRSWHKE